MIGDGSFQGALNVNLVRTTMLIFVALAWTFIMAGRAKKNGEAAQNDSMVTVVKKTFPMFILWFAVMAGLNTMGVFSDYGVNLLSKLGKYLFAGYIG